MTIEILWDDDDRRVLRYDIHSKWTWNEAQKAMKVIFQVMDESSHDVICAIPHFIGEMKMPSGGRKRFDSMTARNHPKAGLTVIVGATPRIKSVISAARGMYSLTGRSVDFEYADTLDEARAKIAAYLAERR